MESLKQKLREIEKDEIIHALKECNCVRTRAARRLGITARMIGYKIKKYGLKIKEVGTVEDVSSEQYEHEEYVG
jgi:Nif-specific regulatory protein